MHATPRSFVRGQRRCTQIRQFGPFSALTLEASWIILQSGQICGDNGPVVWAPSLRSTSSKAHSSWSRPENDTASQFSAGSPADLSAEQRGDLHYRRGRAIWSCLQAALAWLRGDRRLARTCVILNGHIWSLTWADVDTAHLMFWRHGAVRRGADAAREDPLTPRQVSRCRRPWDFLATSSVPHTAFPQVTSPSRATRRRKLGLEDLVLSAEAREQTERSVRRLVRSYRRTLAHQQYHPIEESRYVHMARKV